MSKNRELTLKLEERGVWDDDEGGVRSMRFPTEVDLPAN